MRAGAFRLEFNDLLEITNGLLSSIRSREHHGKYGQRLRIVRAYFQRISKSTFCFIEPRVARKHQPKVDECLGVLRTVLCRFAEKSFRFFVLLLLAIQHTKVVLGFGIAGIQSHSCFQLDFCFLLLTSLHTEKAQLVVGAGKT